MTLTGYAGRPPNCPGFILGATGLSTSSSSFHGTTRSISAKNRSLRVVLLFDAQLRSANVLCVMPQIVLASGNGSIYLNGANAPFFNKTSRKRGSAAFP
jgi:hypothetical protein